MQIHADLDPDLKHCFKVGVGAGAGICPESKMSKMGGSDPAKNIQDNFYPLQGNVLFYPHLKIDCQFKPSSPKDGLIKELGPENMHFPLDVILFCFPLKELNTLFLTHNEIQYHV